MPSIIEGYNYDIFISYRQKVNRGERWVSQFVEYLKTELESTFKEEISVYFDINPHDGLLETHDVDESLKDKLKCLVFIPIISRTYCDMKSFAWEHEFKTFVEKASRDQFGLKVKLPNGNVASRVLPVQIHDLDSSDTKLYESILGGVLRGIEFIYKEPGVNRPLTTRDDEEKNLNRINYRNQINKVALAIKEIVSGLKGEPFEASSEPKELVSMVDKPLMHEKSIIVLPFENIGPDPDQEYFSDGLTEEIITDLSHIHDLLVNSRSSAMTFKGSKKKISEIVREVSVHFALEGSVRKAGNKLRITAQLIDGISDSQIWAEKYNGTMDDVFDIQEKVSRAITDTLKLKLTPEDRKRLSERPFNDPFVYDRYLRAYSLILTWTKDGISQGLHLIEEGIEIAGPNAVLYAGLAFAYFQFTNLGLDFDENLRKSRECVQKALEIDPDLAEAHFVIGNIYLFSDLHKGIKHLNRAYQCKQSPEIISWLAWGYHLVGKSDLAISLTEHMMRSDPLNKTMNNAFAGLNYFMKGQFELALRPLVEAYNISSEGSMWKLWKSLALLYNRKIAETNEFLDANVQEPWEDSISGFLLILKCALKGEKDKMQRVLTDDLIILLQADCQYSWHMGSLYSFLNDSVKSFEWLENSVNKGFINYPMLNEYDLLLDNIRGEERYKKLMLRVKTEWENFEV